MIVIHWGAAGAALATVIAKAVPAMISLVILKRDTTGVRIRLKGFRFEKSKMKSILTVGLPTAIGGSTMQLGFLLMSRNVYVYGTGAMAAYGIGNKVNGLITLPSMVLAQQLRQLLVKTLELIRLTALKKAIRSQDV